MTRAWLLGVLVWLLLLQVPGASAKSLAVQKAVLGAPQAGDELTIYLNLSNPFSENIVVKLRDDNDVGGVHLVTDCALATLRPGEGLAPYKILTPIAAGAFTLAPIQLKYINPETKKEDLVKSEPLSVTVGGTAAVSGSSTQFEKACEWDEPPPQGGQGQQQPQQPQEPLSQEQEQAVGQRIQNSQQAADTQALKEAMEREALQKQAQEEELRQDAAAAPEMQAARQQLAAQGYAMQNTSVAASGNGTGEVTERFAKPTGEQATLSGEFSNHSLDALSQASPEIEAQLQAALDADTRYHEFRAELNRSGFSPGPLQYALRNKTAAVRQPFKDPGNQSAAINATVLNLTQVAAISMERPKEERAWWPVVAMVLLGAFAGLLLWRLRKKPAPSAAPAQQIAEPFDPVKEARRLLAKAEKTFPDRPADAYAYASLGIRTYISHAFGPKKEITVDDAVRVMRGRPFGEEVREALHACLLVEFAKRMPDRQEFEGVVAAGRRLIEKR